VLVIDEVGALLDVLLANGQDSGTLTWADSEGNTLPGAPEVYIGDTGVNLPR
jgi:hypothetical protein